MPEPTLLSLLGVLLMGSPFLLLFVLMWWLERSRDE